MVDIYQGAPEKALPAPLEQILRSDLKLLIKPEHHGIMIGVPWQYSNIPNCYAVAPYAIGTVLPVHHDRSDAEYKAIVEVPWPNAREFLLQGECGDRLRVLVYSDNEHFDHSRYTLVPVEDCLRRMEELQQPRNTPLERMLQGSWLDAHE